MKLKVNWKELGKQLWNAVKPVLLAAIGAGLYGVGLLSCLLAAHLSSIDSFGRSYLAPRRKGGAAERRRRR